LRAVGHAIDLDEQRRCVATLCLLTPREEGLQEHRRYKAALIEAAQRMARKIGGEKPAFAQGG